MTLQDYMMFKFGRSHYSIGISAYEAKVFGLNANVSGWYRDIITDEMIRLLKQQPIPTKSNGSKKSYYRTQQAIKEIIKPNVQYNVSDNNIKDISCWLNLL